jgi:predicted adenylyl cyclase CyaB
MAIELEAKIRVDSHERVTAALRSAGARHVADMLEDNLFLDTEDHDLRIAGCGLRVRVHHFADGTCPAARVTWKGPRTPGAIKSRPETEFGVDDAMAAISLFESLGYQATLRFEKRRSRWQLDGCTIELDELPHLGFFVEIEGPDEATIRKVQQTLRLTDEPLTTDSYAGMLTEYLRSHGITSPHIRFKNCC